MKRKGRYKRHFLRKDNSCNKKNLSTGLKMILMLKNRRKDNKNK